MAKLPRILEPLQNLDDFVILIAYFKEVSRSYSYKKGRTYGRIHFRNLSFRIKPKTFEYITERLTKF